MVLIWFALQKEKEDLEDISNELELADEGDMIPYVLPYFPPPELEFNSPSYISVIRD